jgi:enterochelin esterase-like enzyme
VKRAVGVGLAGLFLITLAVAHELILGHAVARDTAGNAAQLVQPVPLPSLPADDNAGAGSAPIAAPPRPVPTQPAVSRIFAATFYSHAMQMQRSYEIYLPASYEQAPDRTYPVLYLLHGDDGRVDAWASLGLQGKMDQAIVGGAPEMIVVMPDGSGRFGDETDWANRWDGTDPVEDQVMDLVSFVDQNYRTISDRSTRFIGGLSSGGFGSLNIALHHEELFSTAMSFSGFSAANDREADAGVFGEDPGYVERNSPATLVTSQAGAGDIYYVLSGGQRDPYFQQRMAEFNAELDRLAIGHEFHVVPGAHDGTAWDAGLDFGLAHLAAQIRAVAGPPSRASE